MPASPGFTLGSYDLGAVAMATLFPPVYRRLTVSVYVESKKSLFLSQRYRAGRRDTWRHGCMGCQKQGATVVILVTIVPMEMSAF